MNCTDRKCGADDCTRCNPHRERHNIADKLKELETEEFELWAIHQSTQKESEAAMNNTRMAWRKAHYALGRAREEAGL